MYKGTARVKASRQLKEIRAPDRKITYKHRGIKNNGRIILGKKWVSDGGNLIWEHRE